MENKMLFACLTPKASRWITMLVTLIVLLVNVEMSAQCVAPAGTVQGVVYTDLDNNGVKAPAESGLAGVVVHAYNSAGQIVGTANSATNGNWSIPNLSNGSDVKLVFTYPTKYSPGFLGSDNASTVQFVTVPSCDSKLGLLSYNDVCNGETMIVTPCFVQGTVAQNSNETTLVGIKYGFDINSQPTAIAKHSETGSVWGITYKQSTSEIFSSAFVKQLVGLKNGHDAIFRTVKTGSTYSTTNFANLSTLGQAVGTLSVTDVADCNYGSQVGKIGLGSLIISPDEKYLYTVNLFNNTLVRIPTTSPTAANTVAFNIPNPNCGGGSYRPFALKYHKNKIYVGVTCTADVSLDDANSSANVYEYDPAKNTWTVIFSTPFLKGFWYDAPSNDIKNMQWLTDIDFSDDGNMILGLTDRLGHRFCNTEDSRLDEQKPDILMVWNNNGVWTLESNGSAGALIGTGVGNGQGPSNGEFFGHDFFPNNPTYHSEVSLGGLFVLPGTNSVVSVVFDPDQNTYSGGLHRYSTTNGELLGKRELYTRNVNVALGKATGFGDVIAICSEPGIEIGNLVWYDTNENGIQDAGEDAVSGLKLNLYDANCNQLATTTTNSNGQYAFNSLNAGSKIIPDGNYFIGLDNSQKDVNTGNIVLNGVYYQLTQNVGNQSNVNNDAQNSVANCDKASIATKNSSTSHNYDIGLKSLGSCNVKISSSLTSQIVFINDPLTYNIEVENIGGTLVTGFELSNPLPQGMTFTANENTGWTNAGGVLTYVNNSNLAPDQTAQVRLVLRYNPSARNINHTNRTSISKLRDYLNVWNDDIEGCLVDEENSYADATPLVCDLALVHNVKRDQVITKNGDITLVTTVCNQGNLTASEFTIVNYRNQELDFNPALNRDWTISQDLEFITMSTSTPLEAGECRDFEITYTINGDVELEEIVNYAEIRTGACQGTSLNRDFDSTPDNRKTNDNGGQPNTATDNEMNDLGQIDEDDHDPAVISLKVVDFALTKTVKTRRVKANELVTFDISVTNQGDVAASKLKITDYVPTYLTLADANWRMVGNNAERLIIVPGNLQPGASLNTTITFKVSQDVPMPFTINNVAEITGVYDALGRDISSGDVDSTPDNIQEITSEDDNSKASVVLFAIQSHVPCSECRQGTTPDNGQFVTEIKIAGPSNEEWVVESSLNLYDISSPLPPAAPVALEDEYELIEVPIISMPGHSMYTLRAIHLDGENFAVRFINRFGELEQVESSSNACNFDQMKVTGPQSVCENAIFEYNAETEAETEEIIWYIDGDEIDQTGNAVTINWGDYPIGAHLITVVAADNACIAPVEYAVSTGVADVTSISCTSNLNISMDGDCEIEITPSMLAAGNINLGSPYIVVVMDQHGNVIPTSPFVTKEHIGKRFMAKLIDGCGGNSCWSNILVEDKLAPMTICRDIELPCDKLDEYTGPFETDNCGSPIETKLVNEVITPLTCNREFVKYVDRQYQATDASGNKSAICSMRISLKRPDMTLLKFPNNLTIMNDSALVCGNKTSPEYTGVPTLAGKPIYPDFNPVCNVYAGFTDEEYDLGCSRKIVRKWTVIEDWCSNPNLIYTKNQIIEIVDTVPPVIEPLANQFVSTNGSTICVGDVTLAVPTASDSCSSRIEIDVVYSGGFIDNMTSPKTITLPVGKHPVQYIVYDECNNSSSISIIVEVEDNTAPTMLCKGTNAVGLNNNGEAFIYPHHIDNGSFDGCGIVDKKIALMTGTGDIPLSQYGPSVRFDCEDAGSTFMVALLVTDESRNSNSCMVRVEIQDKIAPVITCPSHRTVECGEIDNDSDLTIYGEATAFDICGAEVTEETPTRVLSTCGTGQITRYFTADDGQSIARCIQILTIEKYNVWNPKTDLDESVDFEIDNMCNMTDIHPDNLEGLRGYPVIRQDVCDMVAATFDDRIYNIVQGACMKVLRKWTVIDWCAMQADSNYVPYEFTQVIKIVNTIDPEFEDDEIAEIDTVYSAQGNCIDAPFSASVNASHQCALTDLEWSYSIDYGNDGSIDEEDNDAGNEFEISTDLPLGENRIVYSFEDGCGNVATRTKIILALNRDLPIVVPVNPVIIAIQPWDTNGDGIPDIEKACLDAATLDASSTAACCEGIPLTFSFSADPDSTTTCFNCFDVGPNNYVQLWAHDCSGNSSFTVVQVIVQDNNNSNICEIICNNNRPIISLNNPTPACPGAPVVLTATVTNAGTPAGANSTFVWSTGATTASITVNPTTATTYTVTVSNQTGCTATASRNVTVRTLPNVAISGNQNICQGQSTTLTASGASTYVWSNGLGTANPVTVSPNATITYTVTGTDGSGCTNTATRTINVGTLPAVTINPAIAPTICAGSSTQLTAVVINPLGTPTFVWSNNLGTNAVVNVSPATTTTYTVTATVNGCSNIANKVVTVNTATAAITGNNTICAGGSTTFTASGGGTYLWSNSATTASINIAGLTTTTVFIVTVTATNGCTATATRTLTVNALPVASVTTLPANGNVCINGTATLMASGGTSFLWSTGATTASITTPALTSNTPPNAYSVTVTNTAGCTATATRTITVLPQPTVTVTNTSPVCQGNNVTLTATPAGGQAPYTYMWTGGSTANPLVITPAATTAIVVTVSDANQCTNTISSTVTVNPLPVAAITGVNMICLGSSTTLTASGGGTYLWSANAGSNVTTASITVSPTTTTTYIVTVTNANNCTATATRTVSVDPGVLMCQTQNITAYLGTTGSVTITPQMISTGTMGACTNFTATVAPNTFACNDVQAPGPVYTVTLTVTNTTTNQSLSCTAQVTIADTIRPTITCPPNQTIACNLFNPNNLGTATATDNCQNGVVVLPPVVISTLNQCNIGTLTRTFTARDASNNMRSCTQVITVNNPNPLTIANISFPANITVTNCQGVGPSVTGTTTVNTTGVNCSDVSIAFTDNGPIANPLCADTIIRTWTVIDSCQLSTSNPNAGRFTQMQTIIVTVPAPVINGPSVINLAINPATCTAVLNANPLLHSATGCNLVLSNSRNALPSFNINGTYPIGTTNVTLTARETCNNQTVNRQIQIIVVDTTETQFTCRKVFPKILDTNPPTARDTARNHVLNLEVSCNNIGQIRVSYSRTNVADSITIYDCSDILIDHTFKVYLWVGSIVVDSCISIATPVDPDNHCTNGLVTIAGNIKTENGQNVPNVLMGLEGATMTYPQTDVNGKYKFPLMDRGGEYTLNPKRDDKPIEGVSTLDLIMIQRHVLKLAPLNSPYKLIAADVNKDNKITASDIVELRKLILGVYDKLPNNDSWRLVDEQYNFPDPSNPFMAPFAEKYYIPTLNSNMLLNWIGVKVGDVNGSYVTNAQDNVTDNRNATFGLVLDNHKVNNGHNNINVAANQNDKLFGYQISLDVKNVSNIKIVSGSHFINDDQYQITKDGQLIISWHDKNATNVTKGEILFSIEFDSDRQDDTRDVISVGSGLSTEYYGDDLQARNLSIEVAQPVHASFEVFGNSPNPWVQSTDVKFAIPADGKVEFIIRDVTGRVILSQIKEFTKGTHMITVDADDINAKGVLIYDVKFGDKTYTGKMLNIK